MFFVTFEFSAEGEGGFWLYRSVTKSHKKGEKDKKPPSRVTIPVSVFRKMIELAPKWKQQIASFERYNLF